MHTISKNAPSAANQQGSSLLTLGEHNPSETTRQISHLDKNLSILLAILYTDGYVSRKGKTGWRIGVCNKSEKIIDLFRDSITKSFALDKTRVRIRTRRDGIYEAIVDSKDIGNFLISRFGNFRTLVYKDGKMPTVKLPVEELIAINSSSEFLKVAFSCDGGVCLYPAYRRGPLGGTKWLIRNIFLSCAHPQLRSDYLELLHHMGIESRELLEDRKILIQGKVGIVRFYELIGFVEGVNATKISRFWNGVPKQHILRLMVESYGNPAKIYNLDRFKR